MAEPDEPTRRIDPTDPDEPTQVTPDPTASLHPTSDAPAQPAAGWTPPALGSSGPGPQGWQAASGQQAWWQAPQGQSPQGQAPQQPSFGQSAPGQQPYGQSGQQPGYSQGQYGQPYGQQYYQGQFGQRPYDHAGASYYQPQGQQPGYSHPGYAQGQHGQPPYGQPPYGQPPYGQQPYGYPQGQFYAGQSWQPPQEPPKRSRHWGWLALGIAVAFLVATVATALPYLNQYQNQPRNRLPQPSTQPIDPSRPSPGVGPDAPEDTNPSGGGGKPTSSKQSLGIVFIEGDTGKGTAAGTGMVLTPDGKVLTNYHVVAGTNALRVTIATTGDTYTATVLGFDQSKDVALLQLKNAKSLDVVKVNTNPVKVGDKVTAVGNAGGQGALVAAPGKVTALNQNLTVKSDSPWGNQEDLSGVIETTAGAVPGHSGGPMFNANGEVIGMTTAGSTEAKRSYAVPIADALNVVNTINGGRDSGSVRVGPAGYLGVELSQPGPDGVLVKSVVKNGPAAKAGITNGSTITAVGDKQIGENTNLASVIRALEPGDQVVVKWITPGGQQKQALVTLGASPVN